MYSSLCGAITMSTARKGMHSLYSSLCEAITKNTARKELDFLYSSFCDAITMNIARKGMHSLYSSLCRAITISEHWTLKRAGFAVQFFMWSNYYENCLKRAGFSLQFLCGELTIQEFFFAQISTNYTYKNIYC